MPRGLLSLALAIVLALAFLTGGCSGSDSGASGANPAASLAIVTYQGLPVQKRWVDTCAETGLNTDSSCVTDLYAAGVTSGNGEATLGPLPPETLLCMTTSYTIPVKLCAQPVGTPVQANQRCETVCQTTRVPCQLDLDCPIGDVCSDEGTPNPCSLFCSQSGAACSVDSDCPGNQTCTGGCINKPNGNALEGSVGVCRSTLVGVCRVGAVESKECTSSKCSLGRCATSGIKCAVDAECGGDTCVIDLCSTNNDCTGGLGPCDAVYCEDTSECPTPFDECLPVPCLTADQCPGSEAECILPEEYRKFCSGTGEPCQTQRDCANPEGACQAQSFCAGASGFVLCDDVTPCPSGEGPCLAPLPGDPCYAVPADCPRYCSLDQSKKCLTRADCGQFCTISGTECNSISDCQGRLCRNSKTACQTNRDCVSSDRRCEFSGESCSSNADCENNERCFTNLCRFDQCQTPADLTCESRSRESCDAPREETAYCGFPLPDTVRLSN